MRSLFTNLISMLVAAISFILAWRWYDGKHEIEPIIGMVAAGGVLLTGLVFRLFPEKQESPEGNKPVITAPIKIENSKNVVSNSEISAGGDVHIGDKTTVNNQGADIGNQFNGGTFNNTSFN
ncbi:MAG: hypothetical protein H7246_04565 [Phycisphaerae bacterium]|nr:hypothetical protein [Saprospiraceae bacterium]